MENLAKTTVILTPKAGTFQKLFPSNLKAQAQHRLHTETTFLTHSCPSTNLLWSNISLLHFDAYMEFEKIEESLAKEGMSVLLVSLTI